jgi:squalene-hopene/tetraprenyl-beta-curcumene cyclase
MSVNAARLAADTDLGTHPVREFEVNVAKATKALIDQQRPDGHFVFELEADATIPAEYILLKHFLGEVDGEMDRRVAVYIRRIQLESGGWPLFHAGKIDVSCSVKAYFALKAAGDDINAPHMVKARAAILAAGGASRTNVFTRTLLALFGEIPWRVVPVMPVEIMLLPEWFPFHLSKISYWARTVIVPLTVLMSLRPRARNPKGISIRELFAVPPEQETHWPTAKDGGFWGLFFRVLDNVLHWTQPYFPKGSRQRAIDKAVAFVAARLNGEDGLGAIFPAMANAVMMYDLLGYAPDHPEAAQARASVEKLVTVRADGEVYCQPCLSPVWDTALAAHALLESGSDHAVDAALSGIEWLKHRQILDVTGDWSWRRPDVRPGGWAFQYENAYYPDVDDTAVVVMAMDRATPSAAGHNWREAMDRGIEWVIGLQSKNGGWGAFEVDNVHHYLNYIPFADHGALLDPPTVDVTARCLSMLAQSGLRQGHPTVDRGLAYLRQEQEPDGSWYGRWGVNYIYGTWSVLCALNALGVSQQSPEIRKAVDWLVKVQNPDGGWGEDGNSYALDRKGHRPAPSAASCTAWAMMGLMAAGEVGHPAIERGMKYLSATQGQDGFWPEETYTGTGFPRVFYLRYHGYSKFFPLWAMARYCNLKAGNSTAVLHGM